jgi:hypothetical protein
MTMKAAWSRPPGGRITRLSELGGLGEKISEGAGESAFVGKLRRHPEWLYKAYRTPASADSAGRLDRLIALPGQMPTHDKAIVDEHTSWPSARVVDSANQTTGVLLPMAPDAYRYEMTLPGGRSKSKYLEVDLLALAGSRQRQMGLPPQSLSDRISVCMSIAATADLLERCGLVYLDWSYANIFWCPADHSAYLIDLDGASFGPRPQIHSPQWDDPHVPLGTTAGSSSDRFRVALLITSCLTGKRVFEAQARTELSELRKQSAKVEQLAELLIMTLTSVPASRPTIARIKAALDAVNGASPTGSTSTSLPSLGGVANWKPIGERASTRANPHVTPPAGSRPAPQQPAPAASGTTGSGFQPAGTGSQLLRPPMSTSTGGNGSRANRVQQTPPARPPAKPSNPVLVVAVWIIVLIVIGVIIASL